LIALTNWSAETFPVATERFGVLRRFEAIVVSGTEGLLKPEPALYELALDRPDGRPGTRRQRRFLRPRLDCDGRRTRNQGLRV
jgi:hypothetical protein